MAPHAADPLTSIICSECLTRRCTVGCMDTHMGSFACHNKAPINGIIWPAGKVPSKLHRGTTTHDRDRNCRTDSENTDSNCLRDQKCERSRARDAPRPREPSRHRDELSGHDRDRNRRTDFENTDSDRLRNRQRDRSRARDASRPRAPSRHRDERSGHDRPRHHRREPSPRRHRERNPFPGESFIVGARDAARGRKDPLGGGLFRCARPRDTGRNRKDPFDDEFFRGGATGTDRARKDLFDNDFFRHTGARATGRGNRDPFGMGWLKDDIDNIERMMKERMRSAFAHIRGMPGGTRPSPFGQVGPNGRRGYGYVPNAVGGAARAGATYPDTRNSNGNGGQQTTRPKPAKPFHYEYVGTEGPDGEIIAGYEDKKKEERRRH
ncbi:hypothetical protein VTI74DRAFT_9866 [Chaetomium olivicolor]